MTERFASLAKEARRRLGVRRLAFCIHDASFPAGAGDVGRGSPYSEAAFDLARFVAALGFDVLQLGPQGETAPGNASPYDSAAFSRSTLSIDPDTLCTEQGGGLLARAELEAERESLHPSSRLRADHEGAWRLQPRLLARAFRRFRSRRTSSFPACASDPQAFVRRHAEWLARDGLYEALAARHQGRGFAAWPEPDRRLLAPTPAERDAFEQRRRGLESLFEEALAYHRFVQWLASEQHARLRRRLSEIGLRLYGDFQVGLSDRDVWALQPLLLPGHRLGAPPSRTHPAGQPWGYRVYHPDCIHDASTPGSVAALLRLRLELFFERYDALRIDHPHGLVCPWVYRAAPEGAATSVAEAERSVREGARLFSTFGVPGHPELARFDIARPDQIDLEEAPWADCRVRALDPDQVSAYARLFDEVPRATRAAGLGPEAILCEVLSTLPFPLGRVLDRAGLGRFRVTGKIDPQDPHDPYRIETADAADWVMIGTHDTPSVWMQIANWSPARRSARARYAAERLESDSDRRRDLAETLDRDPGLLAQAMLAELFVGPAENAMVFWTDLFGVAETYNRPGTVSPLNWSLRLPPAPRAHHRERVARHLALNVPLALALALRTRADAPPALLRSLFEEAGRQAPVPERWREEVA